MKKSEDFQAEERKAGGTHAPTAGSAPHAGGGQGGDGNVWSIEWQWPRRQPRGKSPKPGPWRWP